MADRYIELTGTKSVRAARKHYYGSSPVVTSAAERDALTPDEVDFIRRRDSFYMATVSETHWPYLQHRGGKPGFLRALRTDLLGFADYQGNRQLLSTGNLAVNDRVALFLMDYPQRRRLKILGHVRTRDARSHPELVAELAEPALHRSVERLFLIEVVSYDWNCPKYITPRFTKDEVEGLLTPLRGRIAELEAKLAAQSQ